MRLASGRASGRAAENSTLTNYDRNALQRYQDEQQAKLNAALLTERATEDRADRTLTNSKTRAQQVALGDLIANTQDVHLDLPAGIPRFNISGGMRPSAFGPNTRQAGQNLSRQALLAQMSGSDIPGLPDVSQLGTAAPALSKLSEAGPLDSILNIGSAVGLGASGIDEILKEKKKAGAGATSGGTDSGVNPTTGDVAMNPTPDFGAGLGSVSPYPGVRSSPTLSTNMPQGSPAMNATGGPQAGAGGITLPNGQKVPLMQLMQIMANSGSRG